MTAKRRSTAKNAARAKSGGTAHDVIVVGGGLAGMTLTALLASRGLSVLCLDREDPARQMDARFDIRTTAISYGSRQVLAAAGIWPMTGDIALANPIRTIHILDGSSPVLLEFASHEVGGRIFGWIADNRDLRIALKTRLDGLKTAQHIAPAHVTGFEVGKDEASVILADGRRFTAPLIIGADGRNSFTREWMGIHTRGWQYEQHAIVCTVAHEHPHNDIAVEHFRREGPFAILPMTDDSDGRHRSSIVWTEHRTARDSALHYDQATFDTALQTRFPSFYGRVNQIVPADGGSGRSAYPLGLLHAHSYIGPRMALVAEAAHVLHPIAGQGLNMGLRDIAAIADLVTAAAAAGNDLGGSALLSAYQQQRRFDNMAMAGATDGLNRLFSNGAPPLALARKAGLRMVARIPAAKKFFMKQAMGAAGLLPDLIREAS